MERINEILHFPLYYDEGGQMILDQKGIVLDVRMWGRLTGTGAMNLPEAEAMKLQDQFGKSVARILNDTFKPKNISPPLEASEHREACPSCGSTMKAWESDERLMCGDLYHKRAVKLIPVSPSVVTQSEKGEDGYTAELILNKYRALHDDLPNWITNKHALLAMQEYSLLERSRAIDECQNKLKGYDIEGINYLCEQLEKLKSRQ